MFYKDIFFTVYDINLPLVKIVYKFYTKIVIIYIYVFLKKGEEKPLMHK